MNKLHRINVWHDELFDNEEFDNNLLKQELHNILNKMLHDIWRPGFGIKVFIVEEIKHRLTYGTN
jgi:hypothetical protein